MSQTLQSPLDERIPAQAVAPDEPAEQPPTGQVQSRIRRGAQFLPVLIAPLVLAVLGSWGLARGGAYGADESATRWAALLPLHDLFRLLGHIDAVHGLYYLGMHAWTAFGSGPVALRLPSLAAAVATAGVVTELGRRLSGRSAVGVIAGLLYAVSPFVIFYAQTARSYAVVSLLVASATLVLIRALDAEHGGASRLVLVRRWAAYGSIVSLAGWLNEMALLAVAAHAVTVTVAGYTRRARLHWLMSAVLGAATVVPLFVISSGERDALDWVTRPAAHDLLRLLHDFFGPRPAIIAVTVALAVIACLPSAYARTAVASRVSRAAWRNRRPAGLVSVALPLLVVPPALLIAESEISRPLFVDRYLLYCVIGAALLVADGTDRVVRLPFPARLRAWTWAPGLVVVLTLFVVQLPSARAIRTPQSRLRDFGAPASFLDHHSRPGDGVLFFSSFFRQARLGYPDEFRNLRDFALAETPMASGTFRGVEASYAEAAPRLISHRRIWVVGRPPYGMQFTAAEQEEQGLLHRDYTLQQSVPFHGLLVTLWVRRMPHHVASQLLHQTRPIPGQCVAGELPAGRRQPPCGGLGGPQRREQVGQAPPEPIKARSMPERRSSAARSRYAGWLLRDKAGAPPGTRRRSASTEMSHRGARSAVEPATSTNNTEVVNMRGPDSPLPARSSRPDHTKR